MKTSDRIALDGMATFPLDTHWTPVERAFTTLVEVQCRVEVWWDDGINMGTVEPVLVNVTMGGTGFSEMKWGEVIGGLRTWISLKVGAMGLEGLGITDADALAALLNVEEWRAHEAEHAAGRV